MSSLASPYFASLRHRPRLLGALALAVVVYIAILPFDFRAATQALIAWNAGAWTFLALIAHMMTAGQGRARPDRLLGLAGGRRNHRKAISARRSKKIVDDML